MLCNQSIIHHRGVNVKKKIIFLTFVLCLMLSTPVQAANNQGLDWGVEAGDRLEFSVSRFSELDILITTATSAVNYEIYVDIDLCPDIDDNVISFEDIDFVSTTFTYILNESSVYDIFVKAKILGIFLAVALPIGNWDAIVAAANNDIESTEGFELVNDATHFGFLYEEGEVAVEISFFKVDGSLALISYDAITPLFDEVYYDLVRTNPPDVIGDPAPMLLIAGGAAITIVFVVVIALKRK